MIIHELNIFGRERLAELIITGIILFLYFFGRSIVYRMVRKHARQHNFALGREIYTRKLINAIMLMLTLTIIGMTWEISLKGLSVYFASIFTVAGVALFATWSVISNMTASVVLFFFFSYRIGNRIKIVDGDNSQEGIILDINLFYIKLKRDDGDVVSYPNNLAVQKPILQISEKKVGKKTAKASQQKRRTPADKSKSRRVEKKKDGRLEKK